MADAALPRPRARRALQLAPARADQVMQVVALAYLALTGFARAVGWLS